ncbi:MAG: hypothetical protein ACLFS8_02745 [Clostridia bacterium]
MLSTIAQSLARLFQPGLFDVASASAAASVLIVGWAMALILRKLVAILARLLGTDVLARELRAGAEGERPSRILGALAYWAVLLTASIVALDILRVRGAMEITQRAIATIPTLAITVAVLAVGTKLASFLGSLAESAAKTVRMPLAGLIGGLVRLAVIGLAILISVEHLGLGGSATSLGFSVLLGAIPAAAVIAFGLGGRDLAENLLASQMLKAHLTRGDGIFILEDMETEGTVVCIGWTHTHLDTRDGTLLVPNSCITRHILRRERSGQTK